jgi:RNA polymerase sigma factor (sigma-70 family)
VKNTRYDGYRGIRLPKQVQIQRVQRVIDEELTPLQRETLLAYYIQQQNIPQIAADRGVHKSTVSRTLKRAEQKLRRYLKY